MMKRNLVRAAALFILLFLIALAATVVQANICIQGKTVKISGTLCGRVFDPTGAPVPDVALRLLAEAGSGAAEVRADSKGNFAFSPLPTAKYRLTTTTPGRIISFGAVDSGVNVVPGQGKPKEAASLIGKRFSSRPGRTGR